MKTALPVALVSDDSELLRAAQRALEAAGVQAKSFATPGRFLDSLSAGPPSLVVLALELPGLSGWELIRILRNMDATRRTLVVAVSDHASDSKEALHAFDLGADEYLSAPIDVEVLAARISAMLRRTPAEEDDHGEVLTGGGIRVELQTHRVVIDGKEVHLPPLEFDLLTHFLRNPGRVLTRSLILQKVWKTDPGLTTRTVDKCVERLRRHLGQDGKSIKTVSGVGYALRL